MRLPRLALIAVLGAAIAPPQHAQTAPLTVCGSLSSTHAQKEIVIKGFASRGPHGAYLDAGLDAEPCPGWPARLFTAPSVIPLLVGPFAGDGRTPVERAAADALLLRLIDVAHKPGRDRYVITAQGTLNRKPFPLIFRKRDGTYFGFGFGIYGELLADFVVRSVLAEGYADRIP